MRAKEELESTTNKKVYRRRYKELNASCSFCKWHKNENAGHIAPHGHKKPKTWRDK